MATDAQNKVCLDVAVDHRIRRLFRSIPHGLTGRSDHVSSVEAEGRRMKRPRDEIKVTAELAGPALKGGIAIALQQPRNNHPYSQGLDAVIADCETLRALEDIFDAASCGSLSIRKNITVVDLLPFVSENVSKVQDAQLRNSFRATTQIICDKDPDVLLCAGRIWLPRAGKFDDRKGDAWKFESVGLGTQFGSTPKLPVVAKIRHGARNFVDIPRVNGFHPSHAINYLSQSSVLRQLQMLIAVETCSTLRGDWEDEDWMDVLRKRAWNASKTLSGESPSKSPPVMSPGQSPTRRTGTKYLPEWQDLYSDAVLDLKNRIVSLLLNPNVTEKSPDAFYQALLSSGISEMCNDVTLILRQIARLLEKGWPETVAWKNEASLREASTDTLLFADSLLKTLGVARPSQLTKIIRSSVTSVVNIGKAKKGKQPEYEFGVHPKEAADAFLKLATDIETLLLDLLLDKEDALKAIGQEDLLSGMMGRISLAPSTTPRTFSRSRRQ
ncbi:hypothetical protein ACHAQA_002598 [Verticillium albo-atrum]